MNVGVRSYAVPWTNIAGFHPRRSRLYGGVYVVLNDGRAVVLPLAQGVSPARPSHHEADAMVAALEAYRCSMGFPPSDADLGPIVDKAVRSHKPLTRV